MTYKYALMLTALTTPIAKYFSIFKTPVFVLLLLVSTIGWGQVSITGTLPQTYDQDFNSLGITSVAFTQNVTLEGWYITPNTTLHSDAGTATSGACYHYGIANNSDRSMGALSSGSASPAFGVRIKNDTSTDIEELDISFVGEQWRRTANQHALTFSYRVSATAITSLTTGSWTNVTDLNFVAPQSGTPATALDGNAAANRTSISHTLTVNIPAGSEILLKWSKAGATSPGLAIDDLSVVAKASAAPTYTITPASNNNTWGTVSLSGNVITATPVCGYTYASPAYTVTPTGAADVSQSGHEFTVTNLTEDCTVTINFTEAPEYTVSLQNEGSPYTDATFPYATRCVGDTVTLPILSDCGDYTFAGWDTNGSTTSAPTYAGGATYTTTNADVILYAVYSQTTGGGSPTTSTYGFEDDDTGWTLGGGAVTVTNASGNGVTPKSGTYHGRSASTNPTFTFNTIVASPQTFTFSVQRASTNTNNSMQVQTSTDGSSNWTTVPGGNFAMGGFSTTGWTEQTVDLSAFTNVYVRLWANTQTAVRYYDDISITYGGGSTTTYTTTPGCDTDTITTGTVVTVTPLCAGNDVTVPFTYAEAENFPIGTTTFTAQLSDATGSFASAIDIGDVASDESGSQSITATIPAGATAGTGYRIRVVADNPSINGSNNGEDIIINTAPSITVQPVDVNTTVGGTANFSVTATGGSLTYEWEVSTDCGANWSPVGTNSANLAITPVTLAMSGNLYRVTVSNSCGSIESDVAYLNVVNEDECLLNVNFPSATWTGQAYTNLSWTQNGWSGSGVNITVNNRAQLRDSDTWLELPTLSYPTSLIFNAQSSGAGTGMTASLKVQVFNSITGIWDDLNTYSLLSLTTYNIDLSSYSTNPTVRIRFFKAVSDYTAYITRIEVKCTTLPDTPTDYTWIGVANTTSWDDRCNWFPAGVPTAIDNVRFRYDMLAGPNTGTLLITDSRTVNNLILDEEGHFDMSSTGTFTINGNITYDGTSGATANMHCTSTFNIASVNSQAVPPLNYGNLNASGGNRVLVSNETVGICNIFTPGAGTYTINQSIIDYNGNNDQTIRNEIAYYHIKFSGSGTKTPNNAISVNTNGSVTITGTAVVDFSTRNLASTTANNTGLIMDGGRLILGTAELLPNMGGAYNITGGTIEFTRNANGIRTPRTYNNIEITTYATVNATVQYAGGNITLRPNASVTVMSGNTLIGANGTSSIVGSSQNQFLILQDNATFITVSEAGFYGATAGFGLPNPNIRDNVQLNLYPNSTIEYARETGVLPSTATDGNQTITPLTAGYPNLILSGSGTKTLGHNTDIVVNQDLTVTGNATLPVTSNQVITVEEAVHVTVTDPSDPTTGFNISGNGQLIQKNTDNVSYLNTNTGNIRLSRTANILRTDYVYWSSPVAGFSIQNVSPNTPNGYKYEWSPTEFQGYGPPPASVTMDFGDWKPYNTGLMDEGKGYIVRGSNNIPNDGNAHNATATFTGTPNNGVITQQISWGAYNGVGYTYNPHGVELNVTRADDNWNLLGNPYPSALDADEFLEENTNIEGAVHIWTHGTEISDDDDIDNTFYESFTYNYNPEDYITYNKTAPTVYPAETFLGKIASGQGFFVMANHSNTAGTGNITFNNTMRGKTLDNSTFFRQASQDGNPLEKHRIWLSLISPNNKNTTTVVGYVEGATLEKDRLYDAMTMEANALTIFSLIDQDRMTIQGRPVPFDTDDQVPLGIIAPNAGIYTIAIKGVDGLFLDESQNIYLEDTYTNVIHNIKGAPYVFTVNASETIEDRFILRYTTTTLGIDDPSFNSGINIIAFNNDVKVTATNNVINSIEVYDMLGRVIANYKNVDATTFTFNFNASEGTYIVKATLVNGTSKTQKIIQRQ